MRKYTLYIGLNDQHSKTQLIDTIEAFKIVNNLICKSFDGATIFNAQGIYKHEDGTVVIENTLRVELLEFDASIRDNVKTLVTTLKDVLNQESVAVQMQDIVSELW